MSDDPKQPERVWDEYDWERFLRKQDKRTELYLELLDRYGDHPDREIILKIGRFPHGPRIPPPLSKSCFKRNSTCFLVNVHHSHEL